MPKGNDTGKRTPVYLQHGVLDSSLTWILNFPHQSLAYLLADEGYDVWLGNSRGNQFSMAHVEYTIEDDEFWEFSWDEMGLYDLPAMLNFV